MKRRLVAAALLAAGTALAAGSPYTPQGRCGALPRVAVASPPGTCVGLVADASDGLRFPRRLLEVEPGRFWLVDMGGWDLRRGRLLEFRVDARGAAVQPHPPLKTLLDALDRPHGIVRGPDDKVYVGEAWRIWRTPVVDAPRPEPLIGALPADGAHPLKELAFGAGGRLFFNVGSASDACRDAQGRQPWPCPERSGPRPRAAVWLAQLTGPDLRLQSLRPWATGLRNSMALAWVPLPGPGGASSGHLLQGENSIDYADATAPAEELNQLRDGADYGWPACVANRLAARGYEKVAPTACAHTELPLLIWPAHAAPLQLLLVPADNPSPWRGQLLVVWHGHRPEGHRVLAYKLDAQGTPQGEPQTLLSGWDAVPGLRPLGAPTGITVDSQGRLWVVEDRHRTLLLVQPD